VRAVNAAQLETDWVQTNAIFIKDVPVYLPGVPGVDVRGLSRADILAVLDKIAAASPSEDYDKTTSDEPAAAAGANGGSSSKSTKATQRTTIDDGDLVGSSRPHSTQIILTKYPMKIMHLNTGLGNSIGI
jgi:hypothetical protein